MKRITRVLFAWTLVMCCAMNVNAGQQVLISTNFEDGNAVFNGWGNNSSVTVEDGMLKITNPSFAENSWDAQMAYDLAEPFFPNDEYIVTMKIRGSEYGQIAVNLQNSDNNYATVGIFGTVDITPYWTDVKMKCRCNGEGGKRLIFDYGQFIGDIYIDDFEFSVVSDYILMKSLQEVEFYTYDGWGPDAQKTGVATPNWKLNAPSETPYGDPNLNKGADLSTYSKLYVTVSPDNAGLRILMNRKIEDGQCADTEEASNLISIPSHAWCTQKYCTIDGDTYMIDLQKILKEEGFVRLHAIKGASWDSQATIKSVEVESLMNLTSFIQNPDAAAETGWVIDKGTGNTNTTSSQHYSGDANARYFDSWNPTVGALNYNATQTVTSLPNGTYTLKFAGRNSGTKGAFVYVVTGNDTLWVEMSTNEFVSIDENGDSIISYIGDQGGDIWKLAAEGSARKAVHDGKGYGWNMYEIPSFEVTNNTLTIGITTDSLVSHVPFNGNWFSVTDFQLYGTVDAVELLEASREQIMEYANKLNAEGLEDLENALLTDYEKTYDIDTNSMTAVLRETNRLTQLLQQYKTVVETPLASFNYSQTVTIGDWYVSLDEKNYVACINQYKGNETDVKVPEWFNYNGKKFFTIGLSNDYSDVWVYNYYNDNYFVKSVTLPATLRFLGSQAMRYLKGITKVSIPSLVENIGDYAFYSCENLTEIELPESLNRIGEYAFAYCYSLNNLTIPAKVTSIGTCVFYDCNNLKYLRSEVASAPSCSSSFYAFNLLVVYVPAGSGASYRSASYWKNYIIVDGEGVSVTVNVETPGTLGEKILEQVEYLSDVNHLTVTGSLNSDDIYNIRNRMSNLLTIDLSGTDMTALPDNMFYERYAIQKVVLPNGLKSIGNSAFYQCYSMQNIELPSTLTTIGGSAFYGCDNLTSVEIPAGVTILNNYTFYSCDNLKIVLFNEGLQTVAYSAFEGCINLTEVEFPSTLKRIEERAFYDCYKLSNVKFNEGLTTLEYDAFRYCHSLSEITLPSTLMFCYYPFDRCTNLKTVKCLSLIPPANNDNCILSSDNLESCVLYVPVWAINKYKLTKGWDQFQTIKPLDNYWPENIVLLDEFALTLPDTLPVGYKPDLTLKHTDDNSYYHEDWTYGLLSVNGEQTLSIGTFDMIYDPNMFYDYGRNYSPWYTSLVNNATMRADSICIKMYLRSDRWAFLSFPFDVNVSDIQSIFENTNFVIRKYSGADRAAMTGNTWHDMTVDSVLRAGEGYIWQCSRPNNNYCGFNVSAVNNANKNLIFANETRTISLDEYLAEFSHNRSWNLIGNPFPCYYDTRAMEFTAPITVWNENNNTYNAYSPMDDAYILRPGEAFFVQRPIDKECINFPTDGRQTSWEVKDRSTYNGARSVSAPRQVFNLYLSKDTLSDRTRFVINADAEMGYDMSRDASKFMSSDSRVPQLFTVEGDIHYAINERPMGNGVIALGAYFGSEGTYTLALDTEVQTEVMLVDKLTGKEVNLAAADYTFSAETGTVTDRFEIKFGGATSVEENLAQQVSVQAVGGQIIVNGAEGVEAVVYTADGKQIASVQGNVALDVNPGLYIVKVQGKSYKVSVVR